MSYPWSDSSSKLTFLAEIKIVNSKILIVIPKFLISLPLAGESQSEAALNRSNHYLDSEPIDLKLLLNFIKTNENLGFQNTNQIEVKEKSETIAIYSTNPNSEKHESRSPTPQTIGF